MIKPKHWYGWWIVAICWLIYFINSGFPMYGGNVANSLMAAQTGMSRTILGLGATLFNLFSGLLGVVVGNLITKKGAKISLYVGTFAIIAAALVMGFLCNGNAVMFIIGYGIILGIGINFGTAMPLQNTIIFWHDKKRSLSLGLWATAAGVGSFIAAPIMSKLAGNLGWQACWIFVAIAAAVNLIIIKCFLVEKPSAIGQEQDGYLDGKELPSESGKVKKPSKVYKTAVEWEYKDAIKTPTAWMILLGMCGYFCVYIVVMNQGINLVLENGLSAAQAAMLMSAIGIGSLVARPVFGGISDYVEPRLVWLVMTLVTMLGAFLLKSCNSIGMVYLCGILIGGGFGGAFVQVPAVISNYFGKKAYARIYGLLLPIMNIVTCIAPTLAGAIYDAKGSYDLAINIFVAFGFVGVIGLILARPPKQKAIES